MATVAAVALLRLLFRRGEKRRDTGGARERERKRVRNRVGGRKSKRRNSGKRRKERNGIEIRRELPTRTRDRREREAW